MKVRDLIAKLRKLENAEECEVFVITRSGVKLDPMCIGTEQGAVYVSALNGIGRCVMLDTYYPPGSPELP